MRYLQLRVRGRWAHFRKPETNNNPLTHDFITKTALIGLIGAVLGQERAAWREQFPLLSEDLRYGVAVNAPVRKESWGFTLRSVFRPNDLAGSRAPRAMELLCNPDFTLSLALHNERSNELFQAFGRWVRDGQACYQPILGLHSCAAELEWLGEGEAHLETGDYQTRGFVLRDQRPRVSLQDGTRIGFERVPTLQTNEWWNPPDHYREVVYPTHAAIGASGEHYQFENGGAWCLI